MHNRLHGSVSADSSVASSRVKPIQLNIHGNALGGKTLGVLWTVGMNAAEDIAAYLNVVPGKKGSAAILARTGNADLAGELKTRK